MRDQNPKPAINNPEPIFNARIHLASNRPLKKPTINVSARTCGKIVPKDLDVRVHTCPCWGLVLDRDVNARNVLRREIGTVRAESTPVGGGASTQLGFVGRVASMNQEAHLFRGG